MAIPRCRISTAGRFTRCNKVASHQATAHYPTAAGEGETVIHLCLPHATFIVNRLEEATCERIDGEKRVSLRGWGGMSVSRVWSVAHWQPKKEKTR